MMSTYILPLEPRIKVSVPACNPNTWSHRVRANLGTDHEQVFFGAFEEGIDPRGDPLFAHVPRPLLINATTDDNLNPPRGVWELHSWLYRAYSAFGYPDRLQTTMVEAGHDYNRKQREITYAWMLRWLADGPAPFVEGDPVLEDEEDLWCTSTGDVYEVDASLTPSDLVQAYYLQHRVQLSSPLTQPELSKRKRELAESTRRLMSLDGNVSVPSVGEKSLRVGTGWTARPILLRPERGILLPAVWLQTDRFSKGPVVLFLSDNGKEVLVEEKLILAPLLERGFRFLAVDLRGTGETAPGMERYFWDFLAGRPIFGQRVNDIVSILTWLGKQGIPLKEIRIWAQGVSGLQTAFACLQTDPVGGLILENGLISYEDVIMNRLPRFNHEILLPGVGSKMDFSDVYGALCPMQLTLINPLRSDKTLASQANADRAFARTSETYQNMKVRKSWSVKTGVEGLGRSRLISEALLNSTAN
jgi:pimeloyl-ACP methyl ester carboxylesterase